MTQDSSTLFSLPPKGKRLNLSTKTTKDHATLIRQVSQEPWPTNYHIVESARDMGKLARDIAIAKEFAFDCETSNLYWPTGELYCLSVYANGNGYLLNFRHPMLPNLTYKQVRENLGQYFTDDDYRKYGFNIKFDAHFIERFLDLQVGYLHADGYLASWFVDTDIPGKKRGLKPLCERYLGISGDTYGKLFSNKAWIAADPKIAARYAIKDSEFHMLLTKLFEQDIETYASHQKLYEELDMPTLNEDFGIEREGFLLDEAYLRDEVAPRLTKILEDDLAQLHELGMPEEIDPDSPIQLSKYLFEILGLPQIDGTSTKKFVLDILEDKHPSIAIIKEYRENFKLKTSFVDSLNELVVNGRIHPSIKTIGTKTGRSAMDTPNMQQMPAKAGPIIRRAFIAGPNSDWFFVSKDLKGQELRIMAHFTGPGYLRTVAVEGTIYEEVAATFYHVDAKTLKKGDTRRDNGKIGWLAMQFGARGGKIAQVFQTTKKIADDFIHNLFYQRFPEIGRFQDSVIAFSKQHGYVVSILGRKRHLHYDQVVNPLQKMALERQAINDPIQGTAADQLKLAFLLCNKWLREKGYKSRAVLRIHDEIIFRIYRPEWSDEMDAMLNKIMTDCIPMAVPHETTTEIYECGPDGLSRWAIKKGDED